MIFIPRLKEITVRQDGERVQVIQNGSLLLDLPFDAALALSKALRFKGKKAEEVAQAARIIIDQAILTRVGFPLGLTRHPKIMQEAMKEAAWNTSLRRYIPLSRAHGIASGEVFGTPSIIQHPPVDKSRNDCRTDTRPWVDKTRPRKEE